MYSVFWPYSHAVIIHSLYWSWGENADNTHKNMQKMIIYMKINLKYYIVSFLSVCTCLLLSLSSVLPESVTFFRSVLPSALLELQPELQVSAPSFEHVPAGRLTKQIYVWLEGIILLVKNDIPCDMWTCEHISYEVWNYKYYEAQCRWISLWHVSTLDCNLLLFC